MSHPDRDSPCKPIFTIRANAQSTTNLSKSLRFFIAGAYVTKRSQKRTDFETGVLKDGDSNKRYPNSIVAVIRGIVAHWTSTSKERSVREQSSPKTFLTETPFQSTYYETLDRYSGIKNASGQRNREDPEKAAQNIAAMLTNFGAESKNSSVEYYHLRAFSDFLGITESSLLAFAKCCSIERRAENGNKAEAQQALAQFIDAEIRFLGALRDVTMGDDFDQFTFESGRDRKTKKQIWIADVAHLRSAIEAFRSGDLAAYDAVMKRP